MTTTTKATQKVAKKYEEIVTWLLAHECDVDHAAFRHTCDDLIWMHFCEQGLRVPATLRDTGVLALEYASCLFRTTLPREIVESHLPGAAKLREIQNA